MHTVVPSPWGGYGVCVHCSDHREQIVPPALEGATVCVITVQTIVNRLVPQPLRATLCAMCVHCSDHRLKAFFSLHPMWHGCKKGSINQHSTPKIIILTILYFTFNIPGLVVRCHNPSASITIGTLKDFTWTIRFRNLNSLYIWQEEYLK